MEILNKNQRETAVWRLVGFGFLVLLANAFIMFASFKAFQDKGAGDANSLKKQLEECQATMKGLRAQFEVDKNKLTQENKKLKDQMKNQDPEKKGLEVELKILKTKYDLLERDLNRCLQGAK